MEHKINLLKDKEDYKRELTKDKIFNITGEKGSGIAAEGSNYEFLDRADFPLLYKEPFAEL